MEYNMGKPRRNFMIYFSVNKKKLDKEQAKLLAKYKKNKATALEVIPEDKFRFMKLDTE